MAPIWTHGVWTVKPGREDEFVRGWQEMARAGLSAFEAVEPPRLLRDLDRPNMFVSFGHWPSRDEVDRFRNAMDSRFDALEQDVLESFQPSTLDEVPFDG